MPQLLGSDIGRRIIEMTIVRPPFILDFAQSALDDSPEFEEGVLEWHFDEIREAFEDHWPTALQIYQMLERRYGIYHLDLKPRNVNFGDE